MAYDCIPCVETLEAALAPSYKTADQPVFITSTKKLALFNDDSELVAVVTGEEFTGTCCVCGDVQYLDNGIVIAFGAGKYTFFPVVVTLVSKTYSTGPGVVYKFSWTCAEDVLTSSRVTASEYNNYKRLFT